MPQLSSPWALPYLLALLTCSVLGCTPHGKSSVPAVQAPAHEANDQPKTDSIATELWSKTSITYRQFTPVVADTLLLVAGSLTQVDALHLGTGDLLWSYDAPLTVKEVGRVGEQLWITGPSGMVVCLDLKDGHPIWQTMLDTAHHSLSKDLHPELHIVTGGTGVTCIRKSDGKVMWQDRFKSEIFDAITGSNQTYISCYLLTSVPQAVSIRSYDNRTGKLSWEQFPDGSVTKLELTGTTLIAFSTIYDFAVNAHTGERIYGYDHIIRHTPPNAFFSASDNSIITNGSDPVLLKYSIETQRNVWECRGSEYLHPSYCVFDGFVYVQRANGTLLKVDASNGTIIGEQYLESESPTLLDIKEGHLVVMMTQANETPTIKVLKLL